MYKIKFDAGARLLRLRIEGFWDPAIADAFARDLALATSEAGATGPFCVISDARKFSVQAAPVVERFRMMAEQGSSKRTAIIVTSALARAQAQRSMASERVRLFDNEPEAMAWLTSEPATIQNAAGSIIPGTDDVSKPTNISPAS